MSIKPLALIPVLILALSAGLVACTDPQPPQPALALETEPNDSAGAANALGIGTPLTGSVAGQARDTDFFKFSAEAGDQLKLSVRSVSASPGSTLDPYVSVLMPDGFTVLEHDDDGGAGLESELRFNIVTGGSYFVALTSFKIHDDGAASDDRAANTYQIALTRR